MNIFLELTKNWFFRRNNRPNIRIERKPAKISWHLTTALTDKVEIALDDWVRYVRIVSTNRVYGCIGETIQNYSVVANATLKETSIDISTWGSMPSRIMLTNGARSISFIAAANGAVWTTLEMWGEDDL